MGPLSVIAFCMSCNSETTEAKQNCTVKKRVGMNLNLKVMK